MIPLPDKDFMSTAAVRQITDEDIVYSTIIESHPILEKFVDRFDLCSVQTGERFNKTEKRVAVKPTRPVLTSEDYSFLRKIADRIHNREENYEKNLSKKAKQRETKRIKKSATNKFELMVASMVIPVGSLADPNCFKDSTLRGFLSKDSP